MEKTERGQPLAGQVLRKKEVLGLLKCSDPTLWRLEKKGEFPRRFNIGPGSVVWDAGEVLGWLEARRAARSGAK